MAAPIIAAAGAAAKKIAVRAAASTSARAASGDKDSQALLKGIAIAGAGVIALVLMIAMVPFIIYGYIVSTPLKALWEAGLWQWSDVVLETRSAYSIDDYSDIEAKHYDKSGNYTHSTWHKELSDKPEDFAGSNNIHNSIYGGIYIDFNGLPSYPGMESGESGGIVSATGVHPQLQAKMSILADKCAAAGCPIKITETVRSAERQDALYAQGRTMPGQIVTNAKGLDSMHCWGVAFDVARADGMGAYNESGGYFERVGAIGRSIGLEWGGDWSSFKDKPHFQLSNWGSGPARLKSIYGTPAAFMSSW